MLASLLSTKLYIPPARANGVSRPRLIEKLLAVLAQPGSFGLLSGPAGFGKTTLLSEFAAALRQPVAWVSVDARDNDPIRFWSYVIAACQSVQVKAGESALALLQLPQDLPVETIPSLLINDLAELDQELVLILDDYHTIQNDAIHAAVAFLLDHLPKNLHVVISTRIDPPWPLARFRARNQLVEIRAQDLRFTPQEAAFFLNRMMELELPTADVETLEERTEGWAAGLQLAALSMKGRSDTTGFVKALKGSHVYIAGYLVEEVLILQPPEVQEFLLQTSILERLNASLCEAVTGCQQGQAMLLTLQHQNLFVISLDDDGKWFRYHNLFADLLRASLQRNSPNEKIIILHQRAAAWFEQTGMIPEAIEHSQAAQDHLNVVRLVENNALQLILQAHVRTVEGWLQNIHHEYLEKSPRLNLAFAWLNLLRGAFPQTVPYLERLRSIFSAPEAEKLAPSLQGEWLALRSKVLSVQGKPAESRDLGSQALQILPEKDALMRSMVYINLATTYEQMLEYDHAAETFQMIARNARLVGDFTFETLGLSGQARMELVQGHLRQTFKIASEGINRVEVTGRKTPFSATFYGELSQVYYQWHQLDAFQVFSVRSVQASGKSGYSDPEIYNNILLSKLYQMEGDWDAAAREMQKAMDLAGRIPPAMIRENVISQQVRVLLAFDRLAEAQKILEAEGFTFGESFEFPELAPGSLITHPVGLLYNSALRIVLSQGQKKQERQNFRRGVEFASVVLAGELHCSHIPIALETLLIRSQMYMALDDETNRLGDVVKALELAEPEGFISVFVEEGTPVAEALVLLQKRSLVGTVRADTIQKILNAFPKKLSLNEERVSEPLVEPLTNRELDVLRLIAAGDSNQEIANKLVISVSAVKKHTSNIFGKLGVNSRTQAAARARHLNLN